MKTLTINLDLPPSKRWDILEPYKEEINELIGYYLEDLGDVSFFEEAIELYKQSFVSPNYIEEIRAVAALSRFTENQILLTNLYYDALKFVFGCTAFTHHQSALRMHARNLDWWTENDALSRFTTIFHFEKNGQRLYSAVGWPGFIGILSGMRPNGYSITLNAVLSDEGPNMAEPITFLIRKVLEEESTYEGAVATLRDTPIASDCLLMVVGRQANEACVIERTPTKSVVRTAQEDILIVTNDYKQLDNVELKDDVLQSTSCGRYDGAKHLLKKQVPHSIQDSLKILMDKEVKMGITVQQMVFNLTDNEILVV